MKGIVMKKVAYLILAYNDAEHLERLIKSVNYNCDFFIHIDYKAKLEDFRKITQYSNVFFCRNRKAIYWAGFNMVDAMKELIKVALERNENYCHLVFLSGTDYPVKDKKEIYEYFIKNEGKELIKAFYISESNCKHCYDKVQRYRFYDKNIKFSKIDKIIKKVLTYILYPLKKQLYIGKEKIKPAYGSQWFAITPECAKYVLNYAANNKFIDKYFKTSFAPDEMYFHTIIFNSKFKYNTTNGDVIDYINSEEYVLNNYHLFDKKTFICKPEPLKLKDQFLWDMNILLNGKPKYNGSISYYTEKDLEYVLNTDNLFIRKVNTKYSKELLDKIDKHVKDYI